MAAIGVDFLSLFSGVEAGGVTTTVTGGGVMTEVPVEVSLDLAGTVSVEVICEITEMMDGGSVHEGNRVLCAQ